MVFKEKNCLLFFKQSVKSPPRLRWMNGASMLWTLSEWGMNEHIIMQGTASLFLPHSLSVFLTINLAAWLPAHIQTTLCPHKRAMNWGGAKLFLSKSLFWIFLTLLACFPFFPSFFLLLFPVAGHFLLCITARLRDLLKNRCHQSEKLQLSLNLSLYKPLQTLYVFSSKLWSRQTW